MLGVLRRNPLSPPVFRSDQNAARLRSSPDQAYFPIRTPFNLSSPIFTSTRLATASLPESSQDNSRLVFSLFQSYGFSDEQIDAIVSKSPHLLSANPERTIKSKLDYLLSFGYSPEELIALVLADPMLLDFSLEKRLINNLNVLLNLLGSKELLKKAITRHPRLIRWNFEKYVLPNMEMLRENGVPARRIIEIITSFPKVIIQKPDVLVDVAKELRELGFDPSSRVFIVASSAKVTMQQFVWDRKVELYKSFGWSDADFLAAFMKVPQCMLNSEVKIKKMMEFYVNKLGWDPVFLSEQPFYISLSLEKRVIPRCAVLEILASRGLLSGEQELHRILVLHHSLFEAKFVSNYKESVPAVLEAYQARQEDDLAALRSWQITTRQTAAIARKAPMPASSRK